MYRQRVATCYGKFVSDGMKARGAGGLSLQTALFKKHKLVLRYQGLSNVLVSADVTCLLNSGVVHMTCTGFQKEVTFFTVLRLSRDEPFLTFECQRPFMLMHMHNCSHILPVSWNGAV